MIADTATVEDWLSWRDLAHLQDKDMPMTPAVFRHDISSYVHPSHLSAMSPMLDDSNIAGLLAKHHRTALDLSRLIINQFALDPADETDVESKGRNLVLGLHQEGSRRLLLVGACCLAGQIRQVIDGPRVGWLMNILSERGYVGVLRFGQSWPSDARALSERQLADCQDQSTLESLIDNTAWLAFGHWLSTQESAFRQRVILMFPKGMNPDKVAVDGQEFGAPLADVMTAVAHMDISEVGNRKAVA